MNSKKIWGLTCSLALLLLVGCGPRHKVLPGAGPNAADSAVPIIPPYRAKIENLCDFSGIQTSPHGRFAILDRGVKRQTSMVRGGTDLVVVDLACTAGGAALGDCVTTFLGLDGLRALSWTTDEHSLFAVENRKSLIRIEFDDKVPLAQTPARVVERVPVNQEIADTLVTLGPASSSSAEEEIVALEHARLLALRSAKKVDVPVGVYSSAALGARAIAFDRELRLVMLSEGMRSQLTLRSPEMVVPHMTFRSDSPDVPVLIDVGVELHADGPKKAAPFSRPIISATDGSLLGKFDRYEVAVDSSAPIKLDRLQTSLSDAISASPGFYLQDVSAASDQDFAYLLKDIKGRRKFGFSYRGSLVEHECTGPSRESARVAAPIPITDVALGTEDRPLAGVLATPPSPRGLAIVFHGGPAGDKLTSLDFAPFQEYLGMGWQVLGVGYSGTLGGGVEATTRLRSEGIEAAVTADAEAVARYVRSHHTGQPIAIYGESFGALPATSLASLLPSTPLFLVAPFLLHQKPSAWVSKMAGPFNRINVRAQELTERALLGVEDGDDAALKSGMRRILASRPAATPTFIVFAKDDPLSQPTQLPGTWRTHVTQHLVPGDHQFVAAQPTVWPTIQHWMAATFPR
ncbi:alpha/beta hydrolase [Variovorax saccharolyticus]|uniref:alpha/beta hydrolase n=1 Tax=Variovorax saccharolyticus TaxID=3053516 RepID=UPI0025770425|nr:hypothetical protein [Variovorax sp. J31P216]MDM0029172.1 hypothetical protein [Variovorax sp. J31P216]